MVKFLRTWLGASVLATVYAVLAWAIFVHAVPFALILLNSVVCGLLFAAVYTVVHPRAGQATLESSLFVGVAFAAVIALISYATGHLIFNAGAVVATLLFGSSLGSGAYLAVRNLR